MNTTQTFPTLNGLSGNIRPMPAASSTPAQGFLDAWRNAQAIAGVVILELYRRKDFYVLFVLTALITVVLGSVTFFGEANVARYLKEVCLFLIWVSTLVIAITTTARQVPAERESRTLFPLLAKPVTRNQLLLGKFLGCWEAVGVALVVFYTFFGVISGARENAWPLANYLQAATLHWALLGIVIAMTLTGSVALSTPSANNTIVFVVTAGILLLGRHLNKVALRMEEPSQSIVYAIYYALPHLELFDVRDLIIHNWPPVPWLIWCGALGYALVYTAIFLALACLIFRRKAVN